MQCIRCDKIFRRVPIHKAKWGTVIQSRAKLCPECRKKGILERVKRQKKLKDLYLLKGGKQKMAKKSSRGGLMKAAIDRAAKTKGGKGPVRNRAVGRKIMGKTKTTKTKKPLTKWQLHVKKTWKEMKTKNDSVKFKDALIAAKKTYKKE